jgi:hypothetical protein
MAIPSLERFATAALLWWSQLHSLRGKLVVLYVTRMVARCETVVQWDFQGTPAME